MAEPFLAEIRLMSFNFAPKGWALCNGQTLPINQNQALFSLLGTTIGGDGRVNLALPELQSSRGRLSFYQPPPPNTTLAPNTISNASTPGSGSMPGSASSPRTRAGLRADALDAAPL
jgi:microcystin-dependent protein